MTHARPHHRRHVPVQLRLHGVAFLRRARTLFPGILSDRHPHTFLASQRADDFFQATYRAVAAQRCRAHYRDGNAIGIVFDLNPVITFDLALIGILLFLAYAVVFLCAITEKTDSHAYRAFSLLMLSYFGGCIVGRAVSAWAMFGTMRAHDIVVLTSILAVLMAMLLCVRNGFMPKQLIALFDPGHMSEKTD
ncbi:MAG: hypothetical protein ACLTMP_05160 [Eggerthella lenta]